MVIGVLGAGGRLGAEVVKTLAGAGLRVLALCRTRRPAWDERVDHRPFSRESDPVALTAVLRELNVLINVAPVAAANLHRRVLMEGCHLVDVGVDPAIIRELLDADELARLQQRSLVAMAGLAPGMTGMIGANVLERFPRAARVEVCLVQSRNGSSGVQGTREMLDLLTGDSAGIRARRVHQPGDDIPAVVRLFDFAVADGEGLDRRLEFATGFDSGLINGLIRTLARLRRGVPSGYHLVRNAIAHRKAAAPAATREAIVLSAVALGEDGCVLGWRSYGLTSDYGATAAVACVAAVQAASGACPPGAGHLRRFIDLDALTGHRLMRPVIANRSQCGEQVGVDPVPPIHVR